MQYSARELEWNGALHATERRVVLTHHHVVPVVFSERASAATRGFGLALDAEKQLQFVTDHHVDLLAHGHQHHPFVGAVYRESLIGTPSKGDRPLLIAGSGSTGVADRHLGPVQHRCFNLLDLTPEIITLTLFMTEQEPNTFRPSNAVRAAWGKPWVRTPV
jgi:hypothetical protein